MSTAPPNPLPHRLGVHLRSGGVDVAVVAANATRVELSLVDVDADGRRTERCIDLGHRTGDVWHGFIDGVSAGQRYGFRVHGPWMPAAGLRHNPAKLLLDPYARTIEPGCELRPELFGHVVGDDLAGDTNARDDRNSLAVAPLGMVMAATDFDWCGDMPPRTSWNDTVIYEAHVRGFTARHPDVPEHERGTYAGLAHPAVVEHLVRLGISAVELLPVHASFTEYPLARRGQRNYWGYSTLGYFAPHAGYAADPAGASDEFRTMVRALHSAGIEVILDVVYNHTCESDIAGPTVSWRGLDAATYYRLDPNGRDIDTTGTGNSLDVDQPRVLQMILDSLRYWVEEMHVDGFRFDLATTIARRRGEYDPDHPLLLAIRADPILSGVKLIAEPWDLGPGGWRTGGFPPPFAEWNDRYRNTMRDFWLTGRSHGVTEFATRLAGSADLYSPLRGPNASVNFVAAHDGFTMADLTTYDQKHNEANGEANRDGTDDNRSWNHGVEGPTDDAGVAAARLRSIRNLMATLMTSAGVPMFVAGDEFGRTQQGNNNAYCLDDETTWVDWGLAEANAALIDDVAALIALRIDHPQLGRDRFFSGRTMGDGTKDIAWFGVDGVELDDGGWSDAARRVLQMYVHDDASGSLLIVYAAEPAAVRLPAAPWFASLTALWTSDPAGLAAGATYEPGSTFAVTAPSVSIFVASA